MFRLALVLFTFLIVNPGVLSAQNRVGDPDTTLLDIQAEERKPADVGKLTIYKLKSISAADTAALIQNIMAPSVSVVSDPIGNRLLIRASEAQHQELKTLLETLDQPPKQIALEVMFADLPAKAEEGQADNNKPATDEAWLSQLKNLDENAKANISKLRLTVIDNQTATAQFGEQTPVATATQPAFARGERTTSIRQTATGTIVSCTARVQEDGVIIAELNIERSRLTPESGALLDENDDRGMLKTPGQLTTTCKTTVKLQAGQPRVLSAMKSQTANGSTINLVVITAELISDK